MRKAIWALIISVCGFLDSFDGLSVAQDKALDEPRSLFAQRANATGAAWNLKNSQAADLPLGIVQEKPAEGRVVKTPTGYMVPYTEKIPGSDVVFEMIPIAGGNFKMGSPADEKSRRKDEGPQIEVSVEPFWIGKYEVTWAEYKLYMRLDRVFRAFQQQGIRLVTEHNQLDAITAPSSLYDPSFTFDAGDSPNQPAATMTQYAAKQYSKWLSALTQRFYRLPYEAEWEYACRAGTTSAYYFGNDRGELKAHAWFVDNSEDMRHAVGKLKPNPWGLYDMYGNVAEWVLDGYTSDGYQRLAGQSVTVRQSFNKPAELFPRVVRGGSWELEAEDCRSAARLASDDEEWKDTDPNYPKSPWWYTDSPALGVGMRIVRPLNAPDDRQVREDFWNADIAEIADDARNRIQDNGKGSYGIVDPQLPQAIDELNKDR